MNKHSVILSCLLLLTGVWHNVQAAHVAITMNGVTQTMTLHNTSDVIIPEDALSSKTYEFNDLANGTYTIYGYNSSDELNGTLTFTVQDADLEMNIFTMTNVSVTNDGWVYGTDYTIEDYAVHSREGVIFPVTIGENKGNPSFLVYEGGSIILRFVPSAARMAEGYVAANDGRTVNFNETITTPMPMGGSFSSTCPADAEIAMMQKPGGAKGSGTIHYTPFTLIEPESVSNDGTTKTYTWRLGNECQYNMRAWKEGGLTQVLYFYYNTDPAKCPEINFTETDFAAHAPKWIDHDPRHNDRMNDCNILLNINEKGYLKMSSGQEYDLMAERDWQIIPNQTENYFLQPDYHFAVYNLNGSPDNSVVEVVEDGITGSEWRILRAKSAGTAVVTVTYDATSSSQYARGSKTRKDYYGGRYFGALWPENTAVFVVSVDAPANIIDANMRLNEEYNEESARLAGTYVDAEHDVFYYINDEESYDYTFTPQGVSTVEIAYPTIRENDAIYNTGWHTITKNADNSYTLPLKHGRQIVRLGDGAGHYEYQVLTAKHATRTITNKTNGSTTRFLPGSNVIVQYDGLYHPANKLSGLYNMSAYITYNGNPTGEAFILGPNQYWFAGTASAQAVQFTIPADYTGTTLSLTDGVIQVTGFGDPIGNHRTIGKWSGRSPNFTAGTGQTYFGALPDVVIPVIQPARTKARFIFDPADAEVLTVTNSLGTEVTADSDGRYLLTEGDNSVMAVKAGYKRAPITVTIEQGCAEETDIPLALEPIPANGWDGTTTTAVTPIGGIYHISNGAELAWFAAQVNAGTGKTYKAVLDNDIDLCGYNWTPIGNSSKKFGGTFDGQGYSVNNLHIEATTKGQGLFGSITYASGYTVTVQNLVIRGTIISTYSSAATYIGGLAGEVKGQKATVRVAISNVTSYVNITAMGGYVAGIAGNAKYADFDRCANYGNILTNQTKMPTYAAGAAGIATVSSANDVTITNSYNCGNIVANNYAGGIYASKENTYNVTTANCYNTGFVNAAKGNQFGASHGAIRNCKYTTDETPGVTNCYANKDFLFNELNSIIIEAEEPWQSGEVAYKLGEAYGQEIGVDPLPVLGGMKVYEHTTGNKTYYSNYPNYYVRDGLFDGKYGTICFPYATSETDGARFFSIEKKYTEGGLLTGIGLVEVQTLEAGKPYIYLATAEQFVLFYDEESVAAPSAGVFNGLIGTFDYTVIPVGDWYIKDNGLKLAGEDCHASAYRAYIHAENIQDHSANFAPSARRMVMGVERQTPTSVDTTENEANTKKYVQDGRLYILHEGKLYDAQGKRIQ